MIEESLDESGHYFATNQSPSIIEKTNKRLDELGFIWFFGTTSGDSYKRGTDRLFVDAVGHIYLNHKFIELNDIK